MVQVINPQVFNTNSTVPLVGGKIYSYAGGTSTLKNTYPTVNDARKGTNPNTNPVILDAKGRANIVVQGPTKLVLKDADDNTIWIVDDLDSDSSDFNDSNGNELLVFNAAASAVNYIQVKNGITGEPGEFAAVGTDNNIDFQLNTKGTGDLLISSGGLELENGDLDVSAGDVTISSGNVTLTLGDLTVDNLEGVDIANFPLVSSGMIYWFAGSTAPAGYLECDGSAVSRTTYADLFTAIGITFGVGDGSTTFNLPDQARNTLVGKGGTGTSELGNSIGDTGGEESHALTEDEIPAHTHSYNVRADNPKGVPVTGAAPFDLYTTQDNKVDSQTAGSGTAYNVVQPSLVMMMIIKT